jgi:hypothetical protein
MPSGCDSFRRNRVAPIDDSRIAQGENAATLHGFDGMKQISTVTRMNAAQEMTGVKISLRDAATHASISPAFAGHSRKPCSSW